MISNPAIGRVFLCLLDSKIKFNENLRPILKTSILQKNTKCKRPYESVNKEGKWLLSILISA